MKEKNEKKGIKEVGEKDKEKEREKEEKKIMLKKSFAF